MSSAFGIEPGTLIDALSVLIDTTTRIVKTVRPDAVQLLRLLAPLSSDERRIVVEVLEREVDARRASLDAGDGVVGPLDRGSQLFVRVFGTSRAAGGSVDAVMLSCLQGLAHFAEFPPRLEAVVADAVAEALASVSAEERDTVVAMLRTLAASLATDDVEASA